MAFDIAGGGDALAQYIAEQQAINAAQQLRNQQYNDMGYISDDVYNQLFGNGGLHNTLSRDQMNASLGGYMPNGNATLSRQQMESGLTGQYNGQDTIAKQQTLANLYGQYNGQDTLAKQQAQAQTGMDYLKLMTQMGQNPADYFQYQQTLRAGQQTPMASWADKLRTGQGLAAFSGVGPSQANSMETVGRTPAQYQTPTQYMQTATAAATSPNASYTAGSWQTPTTQSMSAPNATANPTGVGGQTGYSQAQQYFNPQQTWGHQLNVKAVNQMNSTDKGLMDSAIKAQGYVPDDFWGAYNKARPQGQAASFSSWR